MTDQFRTKFQLVVANTPELLKEVHKIRYDVYCRELNYETPENCPSGMEQDIYDKRSIHCLLKHRSSGIYAGCVRIVLADPAHPEAPFPFENICRHSLDSDSIELTKLPRYSFCEVSRLAVRSEFRKCQESIQMHKAFSGQSSLVHEERKHFPLIALGLYLAGISVALEFGVDIFAMMEPRLSRHLRRYGFPSRQIGELVEHRGKRAPFQLFREAILKKLQPNTYELLQTIRSDIQRSLKHNSCMDAAMNN